jgi:beta-phosphoglucomutase
MHEAFQAILFDLDGVIINSEELHARAKRLTLEKYGISYPKTIFDDFKGRPDMVFWQYVATDLSHGQYTAVEMDAYKRVIYISMAGEISPITGVMSFIAWARKKFRQLALVSSATEPDLMVSENKFQIKKWFDLILLGEDTRHHKPHPEPYLNAISKLNIPASTTLVIEDSPNGVVSAKGAGCYVIGITTGFTVDELTRAGADRVAASFEEIKKLLV